MIFYFILFNSFWLVCTEHIYIYMCVCVCVCGTQSRFTESRGGKPGAMQQYITYFCENDWAEFDCPSVSLSKAMPARGELSLALSWTQSF